VAVIAARMGFKKLKNKWKGSQEAVTQNNLARVEEQVLKQLEQKQTISVDEAVEKAMKVREKKKLHPEKEKFDPSKYQFTPVKPPKNEQLLLK
jgi:hypothetical protein